MKKLCLIVALLALLLLCASAAADPIVLPDTIADDLTLVCDSGYTVTGYAPFDKEGYYFVSLQNAEKGHCMLYGYRTRSGGKLECWLQSERVIFQGQNLVTIEAAPNGSSSVLFGKSTSKPVLYLFQQHDGGEYCDRFAGFVFVDNTWKLTYWEDYDHSAVYITDDALTYYKPFPAGNTRLGKVNGTIQRDIRWTGLHLIPRTLKDADASITTAPVLPWSQQLQAQSVEFSGGRKYPVYSAPSEASIRSGSGKAAVSTNGWIQVLGVEDGWALVHYSIDADHYRFGYIRNSALPKSAKVPTLAFDDVRCRVDRLTTVTDDPFFSVTGFIMLNPGDEVTRLATIGSWAYIEGTHNGLPFRGFVQQTVLQEVSLRPIALPASAHAFAAQQQPDGSEYGLFQINAMHFDAARHVYGVTGVFGGIAETGEAYEPVGFDASQQRFYLLSSDFHADMVSSMSDETLVNVPVTDLYQWYVHAYMNDQVPADGQLDFWFVTTRVELDENGAISYMEYFYVPWG